MEKKYCGVISAPIMSFPWGYDEEAEQCGRMKLLMMREISFLISQGIAGFYVPLDSGVCLYAAEIVNGLRETNTALDLICVIPHEEQATKWTPELRERYFNTMARCTSTLLISTYRSPGCELEAMLEAVDRSAVVLAIKSEVNEINSALETTIHYAKRIGREIKTIHSAQTK